MKGKVAEDEEDDEDDEPLLLLLLLLLLLFHYLLVYLIVGWTFFLSMFGLVGSRFHYANFMLISK